MRPECAAPASAADKSMTADIQLCRKGATWRWQLVVLGAFILAVSVLLWFVGGPGK